jgi:S1-C subfamily serine protease
MGYPMALSLMGEEVKFNDGKISSKTGFQDDVNAYQISVPIQPGNSGGPLFDYDGNIRGVVNAKLTAGDNVGYAIKSGYLNTLTETSPFNVHLPHESSIASKSLTEKIKIISDYVVLVKTK